MTWRVSGLGGGQGLEGWLVNWSVCGPWKHGYLGLEAEWEGWMLVVAGMMLALVPVVVLVGGCV